MQILFQMLPDQKSVHDLQAALGEVQHIDIRTAPREFRAVTAAARADFKNFFPFKTGKVFQNGLQNRRRRRIYLVNIVLAIPKTIPDSWIRYTDWHNASTIQKNKKCKFRRSFYARIPRKSHLLMTNYIYSHSFCTFCIFSNL